MQIEREDSIRVLVADCHHLIREGLAAILSHQPDMQVVADAKDGDEAVAMFRQVKPDIALMDLRMNKISAIEAIRTIRQEFPAARILVLATFPEDEEIAPALREGAADCLLKDMPREKMYEVIRAVHAGKRPNFYLEHPL